MSVSYYNAHSITFIKGGGSGSTPGSYKRSWYDFKMIPAKNPSVSPATPNTKIVTIPGMNGGLDITSYVPGGLTFSRRTGQWDFYVDISKWSSWSVAKSTIEDYLNGQYCYVVLEDDYSHCWAGRLAVTDWSNESDYPKITISYDFEYDIRTNTFSYNRNRILTGISSSLMSGHNTYYVGDPIDSVRKWVTTLASYDNGDSEEVDIDPIPSSFVSNGIQTIETTYQGQRSSVTVNVSSVNIDRIDAELLDKKIFNIGDRVNSVKPYITLTVYYNNGKTKKITDPNEFYVYDLPNKTSTFFYLGEHQLDVLYGDLMFDRYAWHSYPSVFIKEGKVVGIKAVSKTSSIPYVWLGENKDKVRECYHFYKKYENGYIANNPNYVPEMTMDPASGVFSKLGENDVTLLKNNLSVSVKAYARKVVELEPYYSKVNIPSYMRIGEKIGRLRDYIVANGRLTDDQIVAYSSSDLTAVDGASRFDSIGINTVKFSASNKALGEYNDKVIGTVDIEVKQPFDVINSWEEINDSIQDGSYKSKYKVGDLAWITIGDVYNGYAQIVGIDTDIDKYGDTIPISWMLKETLFEAKAYDSGSAKSYISSSIKSYIDNLESYFPNNVKAMIVESLKDYKYYDNDEKYATAMLKLWLPSIYEIMSYDESESYNYGVNYSSLYHNNTERIKFPNRYNEPEDNIAWITPQVWLTRNIYNDGLVAIKAIDIYGEVISVKKSNRVRFSIGFCTGATEYDENSEWVLRKFKAYYKTLEIYEWDGFLFNYSDNSITDYIPDYIDSDIDDHIKLNPVSPYNLSYPAITYSLADETSTNYIFNVNLYDYATDTDFMTKMQERFNMTVNETRHVDDKYIVNCTMTTNKLTTE